MIYISKYRLMYIFTSHNMYVHMFCVFKLEFACKQEHFGNWGWELW